MDQIFVCTNGGDGSRLGGSNGSRRGEEHPHQRSGRVVKGS